MSVLLDSSAHVVAKAKFRSVSEELPATSIELNPTLYSLLNSFY